jgi:radical SAM superfamily enzyme YgiQ (UPF0313 family)
MKISLIMPGVGKKAGEPYVSSWKMEPLALAVLAALTPPNIDVSFYDDRLDEIPYDEETNLVAINAETYTARRAYEISSNYRKRGIPVILGGFHPTLMPEEAMEFADSILIGEAEGIWSQILYDVSKNQLRKSYISPHKDNLKNISAKRQIFEGKKYLPINLIESGRGCKFNCKFCSIACFYKSSYKARDISEIIDEIKTLKNKNVFFVDDNIIADPERAKELFEALIPLKINWISQGSINLANDANMIKLMKKSGCLGLLIGFESLNQSNLSQMNKYVNAEHGDYTEALKKFRDAGIAIYATFIFGYDLDDADAVKRTLDFAIKQKFFLAAFNHLVPFPGTPLYDDLKKEGRLLYDKWWLEPKYRFGEIVFRPKLITAGALSKECFEARKKFYQSSSILKRSLDLKTNCKNLKMASIFFSLNLLTQKEVVKRQHLPIGEGMDK